MIINHHPPPHTHWRGNNGKRLLQSSSHALVMNVFCPSGCVRMWASTACRARWLQISHPRWANWCLSRQKKKRAKEGTISVFLDISWWASLLKGQLGVECCGQICIDPWEYGLAVLKWWCVAVRNGHFHTFHGTAIATDFLLASDFATQCITDLPF